MTSQPRQLHINLNLHSAGSHPAAWRAPEGRPLAAIDISHFQEVARLCERGLFDAVFLADILALTPDISPAPWWALDPIVIAASMSAVTERVGFILTSSTTFNYPYNLARTFLSLDHASRGRVGWNVVTSYDERSAPNFGLKKLPPPEERYAVAADFVAAVLKLWDSWEEGAVIADPKTGVWSDPARVHAVNHVGPIFSVAGPLQLPRSPQGRPLLVQAGSSARGRDFAAQYAEAIFNVQQLKSEAQSYYADLKSRASGHGRNPDLIAVLPGLSVVIGGTEAEAWARKEALDELGGIEQSVQRFARRIGIEPAALDVDRPVPEHLLEGIRNGAGSAAHGSQGFADALYVLARDRSLTVRQIIARGGGAHRLAVGTPEQIADTMQEWFVERAADGFNIMCDIYPSGLAAFVDQVVPELQRRGLFRTEYEGRTLRDHYGLPPPPNSFAQSEVLETSLAV
jgi:FMN-dependent oxidoreductase (nitrilotriacetate monooxygenase family)